MVTRSFVTLVLLGAAAAGAAVGIGLARLDAPSAVAADPAATRQTFLDDGKALAVHIGIARARPPQPGDRWGGCNDARAAGTAPIYRDEPGYRRDMDGDDDGIACEPPPS